MTSLRHDNLLFTLNHQIHDFLTAGIEHLLVFSTEEEEEEGGEEEENSLKQQKHGASQ